MFSTALDEMRRENCSRRGSLSCPLLDHVVGASFRPGHVIEVSTYIFHSVSNYYVHVLLKLLYVLLYSHIHVGLRPFGAISGASEYTTLQSMMNAKLSKQRFWHCHLKRWFTITISKIHYLQPKCEFQVDHSLFTSNKKVKGTSHSSRLKGTCNFDEPFLMKGTLGDPG